MRNPPEAGPHGPEWLTSRPARALVCAAGLLLGWASIRLGLRWALVRFFRVPRVLSGATPAAMGLEAEDVTISAPGGRLRAWFIPARAAGPQPVALVLHGWSGSASSMLPVAPPLHAAGFHVLLLDALGHGRSGDSASSSMPGFAENVERACLWLRSNPLVEAESIVLVGHSVGAGACLLAAARDPRIAAVVSISSMADAAAYMGQVMRRHGVPAIAISPVLREIERAIGMRFPEFAPIATIAHLRMPVLLIHGAIDSVIPVADAQALRRAAPPGTDLLVVPDAGHGDIERFLAVAPAVTDFLRRAVQREAPAAPPVSADRSSLQPGA
jgi:pimeloyl-ACP methyl ester carboxylesterase